MTTKLHWQIEGQGSDLVLIHGWGMNGAVWQQILPLLTPYFRVHCVDLPGYGHSGGIDGASIEEMAHLLLEYSPAAATWVGWSLGGLIATQAALLAPERVSRLVTVASSPKFAADKATSWRGIQPQVLTDFQQQLSDDFRLTVERFMALQAMGSPTARQDIKLLKQAVLSRPQPNQAALSAGLTQLAEVDLRDQLVRIQQPWLRMYGRLDGLVPVKVAQELDELAPRSQRQVFASASHAPFISHPAEFTQALRLFLEQHDD
ncbi:pimeloyl-ACP methyl ester esterase BioH [Photobacterium sanguinicancri]|uniref:Pimeloyl-[acyl-carrier protein] methyl ester esterase n=1 Tax=Photobacterium sanguinicancri TaxID=875932 RepID=A0ABX4G3C5_9GAMM|nr:pimeloyl-ACP methyl ester esterase BioH [Photobacterium sanguinicancri]OZS44515.1 pimeloyl-[acyl-carrier protein] methyl ester esterase [Photobacterium sanguinicancri]